MQCYSGNCVNKVTPPAGRGGVQHWERSAGSDPASEDHGVLWEEGEADRTAEENVSVTSSLPLDGQIITVEIPSFLKICYSNKRFML